MEPNNDDGGFRVGLKFLKDFITSGEKPGMGIYICRCGQTVTLDEDSDTLPQCPERSGTKFES